MPPKKREANKSEQAAKVMTSVTVDHLHQLDSQMQVQEDARMEKFLECERQLHKSFMSQLIAMQDRQMAVFERMFGRALATVPQQQIPQAQATPDPQYGQYRGHYNPNPSTSYNPKPTTSAPSTSQGQETQDYPVYRQL